METPLEMETTRASRRVWSWTGVVLLALGLLGHLPAASAIGGTARAYRDHIFGFVLLTVVAGAVIFALGSRFWKTRYDISLFALGTVQALIGYLIYLHRFSLHG